MNSFYRNNYHNHKISPQKLKSIENRRKTIYWEDKISHLKNKFGDSYIKPKPEDFQLDESLIAEIVKTNEEAIKKNKSTDKYILIPSVIVFIILLCFFLSFISNSEDLMSSIVISIGGAAFISFGIFSGIFHAIFSPKKYHHLSNNYNEYLNLLKEYPSSVEIQKIKEVEKILKDRKTKIDYWFSLSGHDFETEVAKLFLESGLFSSVIKTKGSGDGGVDIILTTKDEVTIYVECKAHKNAVGPHVIRGLYGAMTSRGVKKGILISLGGVSDGVIDFIKDKSISIIDVNDIIKFSEWISDYFCPED